MYSLFDHLALAQLLECKKLRSRFVLDKLHFPKRTASEHGHDIKRVGIGAMTPHLRHRLIISDTIGCGRCSVKYNGAQTQRSVLCKLCDGGSEGCAGCGGAAAVTAVDFKHRNQMMTVG